MRRLISSAGLALVVFSGTALGQSHPQTRDGFTIAFGLGEGSVGMSCDECTTDRQSAPSGFLSIGGAIRPNLVLSGELHGWTKDKNQNCSLSPYVSYMATAGAYAKINGSSVDETLNVNLVQFGLGFTWH